MSRISRVVGKIFGSGSGVNQIAQFGSLFAGSAAFTTDPATAQSLSNWLDGWFSAAIGGNAPAIEDMNAVCFVLAYQVAYLLQVGVAEWNTDTTYYLGQIVSDGAGVLFVSLTNNNQGNLVTDATNWRRYRSSGGVKTLTANATLTPNDSLVNANAGAGGFSLALPAVSSCVAGEPLRLKKIDSTSNVVTINANSGDAIDGGSSITLTLQNEGATLIPDGSASWLIF